MGSSGFPGHHEPVAAYASGHRHPRLEARPIHLRSRDPSWILTLLAVQWPFADFLMSKAAENRFFGTGEAAEALSDAMMDAWITFAKTGNPSNGTSGTWDAYDASDRATMIFGDGAPYMMSAPNEVRRKAWQNVPAAKIGA